MSKKRKGDTIDLTEDEDVVQISDEDEDTLKKRTENHSQKQKEALIRYERSQSESSFTEQFYHVASEVYTLSKTNEKLEELIIGLEELNLKDSDQEMLSEKTKMDLLAEKIIKESNEIVSFNVSGKIFTTTKSTIIKEPESFLTVLIDEDAQFPIDRDESGACIIERSSSLFAYILKYLQNLEPSGHFDKDILPSDRTVLYALVEEARFFSLSNLVRVLEPLTTAIEMISGKSSTRLIDVWSCGNVVREKVVTNQYLEQVSERVQKRKTELSQQQEILFNIVEKEQKKELELKRVELESKLSTIRQELGETNALTIHFSISGTIIEMDIVQVLKFKDSLICKLVQRYNRPIRETKNYPIFIDREPVHFVHIKYFIEHETLPEDLIYGRAYNKKALLKEANFYNIIELVRYLDPVYRFPIEEIGHLNVAMKKEEDLLRSYFATKRDHPILSDPYLLLINVFDNIETFKREPFPDRGNILFRRFPDHLFIESREEFEFNYQCFTKGIFNDMDWSGVIMAGGSVLGCLTSIPANSFPTFHSTQIMFSTKKTKKPTIVQEVIPNMCIEGGELEKANLNPYSQSMKSEISMDVLGKSYFYNRKDTHPFCDSDIDLFLYGLSEEEAENKIRHIYEIIKKNTKSNVVIMRTSMTITMQVCEFRPIQIILRLYKSPSEVLIGFDIDCCCFAFDGTEVFCLPRGRRAIVNGINVVDIDRQSTTYENRLYKYAKRGFKVCVVGMDRELIVREGLRSSDSYTSLIMSKYDLIKANFTNCRGLARLLLLERKPELIGLESDKRITEDTIIKMDSIERQRLLFNDWDVDSDYLGVLLAFKYRGVPAFFTELLDTLQDITTNPNLALSVDNIEKILEIPEDSKSGIVSCRLSKRIEWIKINPGSQFIGSFKPVVDNFFEDCYFTNDELVKRRKQSNRPIKIEWYLKSRYRIVSLWYGKQLEEAYKEFLKDRSKGIFQPTVPDPRFLSPSPYTIDFEAMKIVNSVDEYVVRIETPIASHIFPQNPKEQERKDNIIVEYSNE